MPAYTVVAVEQQTRDWGDDMREHRVTLKNAEGREKGPIKINRKRTAPPPAVGNVLEIVDISDKGFGLVAKEAKKGGGGYGGKGDSPETRRSIAMQASQKVALDTVALSITSGAWEPGSGNYDDVVSAVIAVADQLYRQVRKAESGA